MSDQVHVDMFETSVQGKESSSGVDGMGLDLRLLTLDAGRCPLANVHVERRRLVARTPGSERP